MCFDEFFAGDLKRMGYETNKLLYEDVTDDD